MSAKSCNNCYLYEYCKIAGHIETGVCHEWKESELSKYKLLLKMEKEHSTQLVAKIDLLNRKVKDLEDKLELAVHGVG